MTHPHINPGRSNGADSHLTAALPSGDAWDDLCGFLPSLPYDGSALEFDPDAGIDGIGLIPTLGSLGTDTPGIVTPSTNEIVALADPALINPDTPPAIHEPIVREPYTRGPYSPGPNGGIYGALAQSARPRPAAKRENTPRLIIAQILNEPRKAQALTASLEALLSPSEAALDEAIETGVLQDIIRLRLETSPIIRVRDLPGPMAMQTLIDLGMLQRLSSGAAFLPRMALTLEQRADIAGAVMPNHTIACLELAAWIWLGGEFPTTLDVITPARFNSFGLSGAFTAHDWRIRCKETREISDMRTTTPLRTICDLACCDAEDSIAADEAQRIVIIERLMREFRIRPAQCLRSIQQRLRFTGHPIGTTLMRRIRDEWGEALAEFERKGGEAEGAEEKGAAAETEGGA